MNYFLYGGIVVFVFVCLILILLVLIQKGRGGGLSSAFGGGGGGSTAFGAKTGDVLTWATSIIFGIFLLLAVILNFAANSINARSLAPVLQTPVAENSPVEAAPSTLPATAPTTQPQ